jgi:hypothetical protein
MKTKTPRMLFFVAMACSLAACLSVSGADPKWPKVKKGIKVFLPPQDQIAPSNGFASFTVVAESDAPRKPKLFYQWQKNGSNLLASPQFLGGVTNRSLMISNVQVSDVGFYTVVIQKGTTNGPSGPTLVVKGCDEYAPGVRLFVYIGTNTSISGPLQRGTGKKSCIGNYSGKVTWPTITGGQNFWFSRPDGMTQCTITDTTGRPAPYSAKVEAVDNSLWSGCAVHALTFSAQAPPTFQYNFTTYVTSGPPPQGTIMTLDVNWF